MKLPWEDDVGKLVLRESVRWLPVALALVWIYHGTIQIMAREWQIPDYSHGFFVPVFSAWLLWHRRAMIAGPPLRGSWWGLGFFVLTAALLVSGSYMYLVYFERISLLPCAAGVVLLVGGRPALKWAWPAIVFLIFMIPLPGPVLVAVSYPLQRLGTVVSALALQLVGIPAFARGNVVTLRAAEVGVVAACSGLRILLLCMAICVGTVMVTKRHWLQALFIVGSAVPIALFANISRITVTALAHEWIGEQVSVDYFHTAAGYLMMPAAMGLLWGEMTLMARFLRGRRSYRSSGRGFAA
jgi:exosortase